MCYGLLKSKHPIHKTSQPNCILLLSENLFPYHISYFITYFMPYMSTAISDCYTNDDEERELVDTWITPEIEHAIQKG